MMISFCPQCGSKVREGAKFCGECGSHLPDEDNVSELKGEEGVEVSQMVSSEPSAPESVAPKAKEASRPWHQKLGKKLTEPVKIGSIAFMPFYAAIIVAVVTTVGVAFAAVMLYQNVIEPAIVQLQQSAGDQAEEAVEKDESDEQAADEQEENSSDEKPATYTAEGNPQSVLQLAEILAMDPTQIPDYLEGQGLEVINYGENEAVTDEYGWTPGSYQKNEGRWSPIPYAFTSWEGSSSYPVIENALRNIGIEVSSYSYEGYYDKTTHTINPIEQVMFGEHFGSIRYGESPQYVDAASLEQGNRPNSIALTVSCVNQALTEQEGERLAQECGFKSTAHYWTYTENAATTSAWTGLVEIGGTEYVWYIRSDYPIDTTAPSDRSRGVLVIGCIPMTEVEDDLKLQNNYWLEYYGSQGVVSAVQLANANSDDKALYYAQALVDTEFSGNGGVQPNVVTGERVQMVR